MAGLMERFFDNFREPVNGTQYFATLLQDPQHAWLEQHGSARRALEYFFNNLPVDVVRDLRRRRLQLVICDPFMSCAVATPANATVVLIFPELLRSLNAADPSNGFAVLAHELGHIVHDHSKRRISPQAAQVEADAFACRLGYTEELLGMLETHTDTESAYRLDHLRGTVPANK